MSETANDWGRGRLWAAGLGLLALACGSAAESPRASGPAAGWSHYAGDAGGRRYSPLDEITPENVAALELVWEFHTGDRMEPALEGRSHAFQATPILQGDALVFCTPRSWVIALDAETGGERWRHDPQVDLALGHTTLNCRGVAAWEDAEVDAQRSCATRIFVATADTRLLALDAATGRPCTDFGDAGEVPFFRDVNLRARSEYSISSPPVVAGDVVVVGSSVAENARPDMPSGKVHAFDARSGALRWTWDPIPRDPDDPARATWEDGSADTTGAANVWSLLSVDEARGLVFLPTSSPSPDFFGGTRLGDNRHADSVVALRAETGERVWSFQTVHHDLWDYDVGSQPVLLELPGPGGGPAVAQATKPGHLFLLDRETGRPLVEVEERPVPASDVPGERAASTQPFPRWPPPLSPQGFEPEDAFGFTFWDRRACREKLAALRSDGVFTPPSFEGSVLFPGVAGGVNWGSVAYDPQRHRLLVATNRILNSIRLERRDAAAGPRDDLSEIASWDMQGTPYVARLGVVLSPFGVPCNPPPWGTLVALDLATREVAWEVPLGTTEDLAPLGLALGWGTPAHGGPDRDRRRRRLHGGHHGFPVSCVRCSDRPGALEREAPRRRSGHAHDLPRARWRSAVRRARGGRPRESPDAPRRQRGCLRIAIGLRAASAGAALRLTLAPNAPHNELVRSRRGMRGVLLGVACVVAALGADASPREDPAFEATRRARMRAAVAELQAEKRGRSAAERKLSSDLVRLERRLAGRTRAPALRGARMRRGLEDGRGRCEVDVRGAVTVELVRHIESLGGRVQHAYPAFRSLRAVLPCRRLSQLASHSDVEHVAPAVSAVTRMANTTEGDTAHYADVLRQNGSIDGSGVTVGVISDGVDSLASVQASGDLPAVTTLSGLAGAGTEGTALLEIVHDVAPGATLLFATGILGGPPGFANSVTALRLAGADVIVDDLFYPTEAALQDGVIALAMADAVDAGVVVVSSAGNAGNLASGTAGVWEGDWNDSGALHLGLPLHDFGAGVTENEIIVDSDLSFTLQWSDPIGGSGNDYDLLLFDAGGTLVADSTTVQNGNDVPLEFISSAGADDTGNTLAIVKAPGAAPRYLHLNVHRGALAIGTTGQVFGHAAAPGVLSVAAADVDQTGPSTGFLGSESVQSYSSDGPRRVFHDEFGGELTPGNLLATGGEVRDVPTVTGADCVSTATPGFPIFCGTSAAAPHIAGVAALLLEIDPAADVTAALTSSAIDLEAPGVDVLSGHGAVDALGAAEAVLMPEPAGVTGLIAGGLALAGLARTRRIRPAGAKPPNSC